jgi:hypothetical protein
MNRRLTPEEWTAVRRRWEGSPETGFDWLAREINSAWGLSISRQAVSKMATKAGTAWVKGDGASEPLARVQGGKARATQASEAVPPVKPAKRLPPASVEAPQPEPPVQPTPPVEAIVVQAKDAGPPVGRPSAYRPEFDRMATHLCFLGATDQDLGDYFGVDPDTVRAWCGRHPAFDVAVRAGKQHADARVAASLFMRAVGYTAKVNKPMAVPVGGGVSEVRIVAFEEYVAPDVKAAIHWLNNRQPENWRNNVTFTPAPPNSIADTKVLDAIFERKQAMAREMQERVAGRMQRLGLVQAMSQVGDVVDVEDNDLG